MEPLATPRQYRVTSPTSLSSQGYQSILEVRLLTICGFGLALTRRGRPAHASLNPSHTLGMPYCFGFLGTRQYHFSLVSLLRLLHKTLLSVAHPTHIGSFFTPSEQLYYSIILIKNNVKCGKISYHFIWPARLDPSNRVDHVVIP